jgi:hypothetical protein
VPPEASPQAPFNLTQAIAERGDACRYSESINRIRGYRECVRPPAAKMKERKMENDYQGEDHEYPVNTPLCWLYEHFSQNGKVYLQGRMGLARVVVFKTAKKSDDGKPLWIVKVSEAPKRDADGEQASTSEARAGTAKARPNAYATAKARQKSQARLPDPPPPAATPLRLVTPGEGDNIPF